VLSTIDAHGVRPSRRLGILLLLILGLAAGAPAPTQAESTTRTVSLSAGWSRKHRQMDGDHALRSHRAA
jgi:hypothetical protein